MPPQYVFVLPVWPNDSSCRNIRNVHFNMANLWVFAAILFAEAGDFHKYNQCLLQGKMHGRAGELYEEISELAWFLKMVNRT